MVKWTQLPIYTQICSTFLGVENIRLGKNTIIIYIQQWQQTSGFVLSVKEINRLLFFKFSGHMNEKAFPLYFCM